MKVTLTAILALSMIVTYAPRARAADPDAKELFFKAEKQFGAGEYEKALELYQRAYQLQPLAGFHFNMGQCHRGMGQFEEAIEQFRLYLEKSSPPKHGKEAQELIRICEQELQRRKAAALDPDPAVAPQAQGSTDAPGRGQGAPGQRARLRPIYFWAGVGLTGALTLTGTITGAIALSKSSTYNDPATSAEELAGLKDSGESLGTASTVTFVLALAAAAGTTALYFYTDFGKREQRLSATPIVGGGALIWRGCF